jgi:hypothetical protein
VDELTALYNADRATIEGDVLALLAELTTKRFVVR